jgi:hypothetical protein
MPINLTLQAIWDDGAAGALSAGVAKTLTLTGYVVGASAWSARVSNN